MMVMDRSGHVEAVASVARAASEPCTGVERARAVLEALRAIVPYAHAEIAYDDPFTGSRRLLANAGYSAKVLDHLHGNEFASGLAELHLFEAGRPACMRDITSDKLLVRSIADVLLPAGYREGLSMCLRTQDGRVTGLLNLSTDDPAHPTDAARAAIGALCATLANVADATQSARVLLDLVEPAAAAIALNHDGTIASVPGVPGHPLLEEASPLVETARRVATQEPGSRRFLWPAPNRRWHRVAVTSCRGDESTFAALITISDETASLGLTRRELEVLSMVTMGWSNVEIGARLWLSRRTVGAHIERVLCKLDAPTRAAAAARAVASGLIIPLDALPLSDTSS